MKVQEGRGELIEDEGWPVKVDKGPLYDRQDRLVGGGKFDGIERRRAM